MTGRFSFRRGVGRRLPAGVLDASLASLATFVTGLVAVNVLDDVERGVYAVFFTAFGLGTVLPNQLSYAPTEIIAVEERMGDRLAIVPRSVRIGSSMSTIAALSVLPALLVTGGLADASLLVPLTTTCAATILLSPTQDHLRRMLHIDGASWQAAAVSAVQLGAAIVAVAALIVTDTPVGWIPFGSLALANLCSLLAAGVLVNRRIGRSGTVRFVRLREMWHLGSWLFVGALVPSVTAFGVAAIIAVLAGPEALGFAEAARIVAQPILVLATGLTAVLSPRIMETAIAHDRSSANRVMTGYAALVVASSFVYASLVGWVWPLNPMSRIVPAAYTVAGLVAVTIVVNTLLALAFMLGRELAAARKQRVLALVAVATAPLRLLVAATAGVTHAFARPFAQGAGNLVNVAILLRMRESHYAVPVDETAGS